mmetsp:Transcript_31120/g.34824  ORF Transcript_31120/g.34824 Transcript_31120/m.34824 type:complete len:763 (-) Transcript_31120:523-2811(-)
MREREREREKEIMNTYHFIFLIVVIIFRITASFFTPIAFQRHCASYLSDVTLYDANLSDNDIKIDHFLSVVDKIDGYQIISRGSNNLQPNENTVIKVFYEPNDMDIFIAISQEKCRIDISKIRHLFPSVESLIPVPADMIQSICGFCSETLPPIGQYFASNISSSIIIFDESLVKSCREDNLLLLGGAGHPYWKSLYDLDMLLQKTDIKVRIDDIIMTNADNESENNNNDDDDKTNANGSTKSSHNNTGTKLNPSGCSLEKFYPKPYFPIDGPPLNIARIVARQKNISNPLRPVFFAAVGRIGKIEKATKKSLRCKFLPPSWEKRNSDKIENGSTSHPWKSSTFKDRGMAVDLIFGKVLLHSLEIKHGEKWFERIQEGQLISVEAKTNPGPRESIAKWVDMNCLELILLDYQLLWGDSDTFTENHLRNRSKISSQKKMGFPSSLPYLTLDNIFNKSSTSAFKYVNDLDSITDFSNDLSQLLLQPGDNKRSSSPSTLVGIDCEWQPREFMEKKNQPQPVLLLQVSVHALQTVFLFDLQVLLRPLKPPITSMNKVEREFSNALATIMQSKSFIVVGYQVSSDLRRIVSSYPHLSCFQEVHSVIEISSLIKRVLHISKEKRSRHITMSLASMTSHYLGLTLDKECQLTDWAVRALSLKQLEYAALDAAVTPILAERVLESIGAIICMDQIGQNKSIDCILPFIQRWDGDLSLLKEIVSWRFLLLPESTDETTISKMQAKKIVGSSWVASSICISGQKPPISFLTI